MTLPLTAYRFRLHAATLHRIAAIRQDYGLSAGDILGLRDRLLFMAVQTEKERAERHAPH